MICFAILCGIVKSRKNAIMQVNLVHTGLYDNMDKIPFDKIEDFFAEYLK